MLTNTLFSWFNELLRDEGKGVERIRGAAKGRIKRSEEKEENGGTLPK